MLGSKTLYDRKYLLFGTIYILFIKYICTNCYPEQLINVYRNMYGDSSNISISILGIVLALIMVIISVDKHMETKSTSESILFIIEIIYFIPGIILLTSRGTEIFYILYFFAFWAVMSICNELIPLESGKLSKFFSLSNDNEKTNERKIILLLILVAIALISSYFSGANLSSLNLGIYDNRALAYDRKVHWIIKNTYITCGYLIPILIIDCIKHKRIWAVPILLFASIYKFSIGSDRIFLFFSFMGIIISIFRIDNKSFFLYTLVVMMLALVLWFLFPNLGALVFSVFDRLGLIPVRVSVWYYDFLKDHSPAFLQDAFPRIVSALGIKRTYPDSISREIGAYYTNSIFHNPNTGLVGGSLGNFGLLSIFVSPISYVIAFRLIGSATYKMEFQELQFCIALIYACYACNANCFLSAFLNITAPLLTMVFLLIYFGQPSQNVKKGENNES